MSRVFIGLIGVVLGALLGIFLIAPILIGGAAGVGIATGLSAGICSTMTAAQEEGLLSSEQIDQILTRAASDIAERTTTVVDEPIVGSIENCGDVLDRLDAAGATQ